MQSFRLTLRLATMLSLAGIAVRMAAAEPAPVKVTLRGVHLHYIEEGRGDPVVLLHGGQGDLRSWQPQVDTLRQEYRVIAYSRRYHYPNTNFIVSTNYSALIDAEDLAEFVSTLKLGRVHLVGTSYGAFTALAFAMKQPELVRSMVLAEPPVHLWVTNTARGDELYRRFMQTAFEPARREFERGNAEGAMRVFIDAFDHPGVFENLPRERRRAVMANAPFFKALTASSNPFPFLPKEEVRGLRVPTLIIKGADTDELHGMVTDEVAKHLPGARRAIIPRAGHGSPRQNAEAFNVAMTEFLRSTR